MKQATVHSVQRYILYTWLPKLKLPASRTSLRPATLSLISQ